MFQHFECGEHIDYLGLNVRTDPVKQQFDAFNVIGRRRQTGDDRQRVGNDRVAMRYRDGAAEITFLLFCIRCFGGYQYIINAATHTALNRHTLLTCIRLWQLDAVQADQIDLQLLRLTWPDNRHIGTHQTIVQQRLVLVQRGLGQILFRRRLALQCGDKHTVHAQLKYRFIVRINPGRDLLAVHTRIDLPRRALKQIALLVPLDLLADHSDTLRFPVIHIVLVLCPDLHTLVARIQIDHTGWI